MKGWLGMNVTFLMAREPRGFGLAVIWRRYQGGFALLVGCVVIEVRP
jgi:hypothetical protein